MESTFEQTKAKTEAARLVDKFDQDTSALPLPSDISPNSWHQRAKMSLSDAYKSMAKIGALTNEQMKPYGNLADPFRVLFAPPLIVADVVYAPFYTASAVGQTIFAGALKFGSIFFDGNALKKDENRVFDAFVSCVTKATQMLLELKLETRESLQKKVDDVDIVALIGTTLFYCAFLSRKCDDDTIMLSKLHRLNRSECPSACLFLFDSITGIKNLLPIKQNDRGRFFECLSQNVIDGAIMWDMLQHIFQHQQYSDKKIPGYEFYTCSTNAIIQLIQAHEQTVFMKMPNAFLENIAANLQNMCTPSSASQRPRQ